MAPTQPLLYMPNRPARPAICLISSGRSSRRSTPSNFSVSMKMIRRMGRLSPMPMASVETIYSISPLRKPSICLRRVA